MKENFSLIARLAAYDDNFTSTLQNGEKQLGNFKNQVKNNANDIANNMAIIGGALTGAFTVPIVKGLKDATQEGHEFEKQLNRVSVLVGAVDDELKSLEDTALNIAQRSIFSPTEILEGMERYGSLGFDNLEVEMLIEPAVSLASVSEDASMNDAATGIAQLINAYGLEAAESDFIADYLAVLERETASSVTLTLGALPSAASFAGADQSVEEFLAAIGILSNYGIDGSKAGNNLSTAFTSLATASTSTQALMKANNLEFFDDEGNIKGIVDIIQQLNTELGGLSTEARKDILSDIFGRTGMRVIEPLMNAGEGSLEALINDLNESSGAALQMAEDVIGAEGSYNRALQEFESTYQATMVKIGQIINPIKAGVLETLTAFMQWFNGLGEGQQKLLIFLAVLLAIVGPLLVLTAGVMKLALVFKAFFAAIGIGMAAGILLFIKVIAIIAAVIAIFWLLLSYWDEISSFFGRIGEVWKENFTATLEWFRGVFENIKDFIFDFLAWLGRSWDRLVEASEGGLKEMIKVHQEILKEGYEKAKQVLNDVWEFLKQTGRDIVQSMFDTFEALPTGLFETGVDMLMGLWNGIKSGYEKVSGWITGIAEDIGTIFKNVFNINSPSRWMRDEIGNNLMLGLKLGIESSDDEVYNALNGVGDNMKRVSLGVDEVDSYNSKGILEHASSLYVDESRGKQPLNVILNMMNHSFKAIIDDITEEQDKQADLEVLYS